MANFAPIKYAGKRFLQMVSGDKVSPTFIPVSAGAGNMIQTRADGLYNGVVLANPNVYVAAAGVDAAGRGTKAAPYKTLDYAIDQMLASAGTMQNYEVTFYLKAGEAFTWNNRRSVTKAAVRFAWFGDTKYGDYGDPYLNQVTNSMYMSDLQRPVINPMTSQPGNSYWQCAGLDLDDSAAALLGVKINLPDNPANLSAADFPGMDVFASFSTGRVAIHGAIVNKRSNGMYAGLVGVKASGNMTLQQEASQLTVADVRVEAGAAVQTLEIRKHFFHLYDSNTASNEYFIPMFPNSGNSSPGSGLLNLFWTDNASAAVPSYGTTLATYPVQTNPTYGVRQYFNGLRLDAQSRPLNVISGRVL
ncbi:hypothetical protein [Achromobacter phage Motura]|uniref:Uncharacterized protein n=1 Tax=Achromobacter phage Motura TaxID=2591403 RepID=A0A514CTA4_9CAUD|nr:hypothetical protein H1O15_gp131 [Achromobacter phage Motura]QDH83680.1 hypothetical protein [Achromobacter phage Motura]